MKMLNFSRLIVKPYLINLTLIDLIIRSFFSNNSLFIFLLSNLAHYVKLLLKIILYFWLDYKKFILYIILVKYLWVGFTFITWFCYFIFVIYLFYKKNEKNLIY